MVTPVSSNTAVELCGKFEIVERTRIGSPYVIGVLDSLYKNNKDKTVVGYEANGGFLQMSPVNIGDKILAPLPTRDPVIVHLSILGAIKKYGIPISELVKWLPARFGASDRLQGIPSDISMNKINKLIEDGQESMEEFLSELGHISFIDLTDGLRMVFENSDVVHFRPSGNAPELRCYVEADSIDRADWLLKYGLDTLKSWL